MQANWKRCAVSSFNRSSLCTRTTLLNIGRDIEPHANTFSISRLATGLTGIKGNPFFIAHPCQQFLCRKPRYFPSIFSFSSLSSLWPLFFTSTCTYFCSFRWCIDVFGRVDSVLWSRQVWPKYGVGVTTARIPYVVGIGYWWSDYNVRLMI